MGINIIGIDAAIEQDATYGIIANDNAELIKRRTEEWEKKNPIDLLANRSTIDGFQETRQSTIGFGKVMEETADYTRGASHKSADGFRMTYTSRTFEGEYTITKQVLEDEVARGNVKGSAQLAEQFIRAWNRNKVEYFMTALNSGFGKVLYWGSSTPGINDGSRGISRLQLFSADTTDGDIFNPVKNSMFSNAHKTVKRSDGATSVVTQSNIFAVSNGLVTPTYGINLKGSDPAKLAKLADILNQVKTYQENLRDDNGQYAAVDGMKTIVTANDSTINAALNTVLNMETFNEMGQKQGINPAYKIMNHESTQYLNNFPATANGVGMFIVDKSWMNLNSGLEFTQRIEFTMEVSVTGPQTNGPRGVLHAARERFDVNNGSWQGLAYLYIGSSTPSFTKNGSFDDFTILVPSATIVKPVSIVNSEEQDYALITFSGSGATLSTIVVKDINGNTVSATTSGALTYNLVAGGYTYTATGSTSTTGEGSFVITAADIYAETKSITIALA